MAVKKMKRKAKMPIVIAADDRRDAPNSIAMYFHCRLCLLEKPDGVSPRDWARLEAGMTRDGGVQVWCARHDVNVVKYG